MVGGKLIDTHVHQLRPFNYDPERTKPLDIARQNAQEFLIKDILAHRGDRNRRSTMEFKVKWEDFGETESWEPYKGLRHSEKLHEYLRAHKLKSLIPVENKQGIHRGFFYRFFILQQGFVGSCLVSKSLTSPYLIYNCVQ